MNLASCITRYTLVIVLLGGGLSGCSTTVSVLDAAASTVVDVTVGAVKMTGKAVGKAVDVVTPDGKD